MVRTFVLRRVGVLLFSTSARMSLRSLFRSKLIGTWVLLEYRTESLKSKQVEWPFGSSPKGILIYSPEGYMSAQVMRPGTAKHEGQEFLSGTDEELAVAMRHYLAYSGRFTVPDMASTEKSTRRVIHEVEMSSYPNWIGTTQERVAHIEGDILELSTVHPLVISGIEQRSFLTWRKLPRLT
ncbi:Lipocalin-like domain-containing protein [Aspergillus parasiticus]|uniref:Lipocalin-like domain-containing protein n=1 Tax=Aspergillus parasiticus TaxID=5067 RepID=A0A5N6DUH0_ASPPA|nr:Lipocalin-like domain-containing protein [Aspergillus parasiticus]